MDKEFQKFKIKEYNHWEVYLYKNQCYLGRIYIWAKREGIVDLMQITFEEREELFDIGRAVNKTITELFQPDLINYAAFGNVTTHLHIHLIPRYKSSRQFGSIEFIDEMWGGNYAPYNYNFEITESTLLKIRDAIKEKL